MKHTTYIFDNTLASLEPGEPARVTGLDDDAPLTARLGDIGISEGTWMVCERVSLFGDPSAYRICTPGAMTGTVVALRRCDAKHIRVDRRVQKCENKYTADVQKAGATWD